MNKVDGIKGSESRSQRGARSLIWVTARGQWTLTRSECSPRILYPKDTCANEYHSGILVNISCTPISISLNDTEINANWKLPQNAPRTALHFPHSMLNLTLYHYGALLPFHLFKVSSTI